MLGCAASVMAARNEDKTESLTFLTTMLDFTQAGEIALLIDERSVAAREQTIGGGGILPARELAFVFSTLRGNDLIWPYVVGNYLEGRQPDAFDILYWNADSTNLPGPMYCWYVRNTYLENNLRTPGQTTQCGIGVDLRAIDVPTYVLASREDHIVPWQTAYRTTQLVAGDTRFVLAASGHIAGVINPAARNKRNTGERASRENGPSAGWRRRAKCREAGGRTLASFSRRHASTGTHTPGQRRVPRDRAGARPLRYGARRLNQIWRLEEENHD